MRTLSMLLLGVVAGCVGLFAYQNAETIGVQFGLGNYSLTVAALVGIAYLAGMLSGWFVVGILRRGVNSVARREMV